MSLIQIFKNFIDNNVIQYFVVKIRKYALFFNCSYLNITAKSLFNDYFLGKGL